MTQAKTENYVLDGCALCGTMKPGKTWSATEYTPAGPTPVLYELCGRCDKRFRRADERTRRMLNGTIMEFLDDMRRIRAQEVAK